MTGWAYKTITAEDLKFPVVYGEGKRSRVLATIGVTRGFGDHDLRAPNSNIFIKPFLSSQPEVRFPYICFNDPRIRPRILNDSKRIPTNLQLDQNLQKNPSKFALNPREPSTHLRRMLNNS